MRKIWKAFWLAVVLIAGSSAAVSAEDEIETLIPVETDAEDETEAGAGNQENGNAGNDADAVILDNIYLENVSIGGLTTEDALAVVEKRIDEITGYQILMHMDDETVGVTAKELGVSGKNKDTIYYASKIGQSGNLLKRYKACKDLEEEALQLPIQYQVDEYKVREAIDQYCIPLNRSAVNYGLERGENGFNIKVGQTGITLKTEEAVTEIMTYLKDVWRDGPGNIYLPVQVDYPKGSREELSRVTDRLGSGSTDYSKSSAQRAANIKNGTALVNGTLVYPGDSFSFTSFVVPFTEENGYYPAPSYESGEVVETYGGGICQVSTTLYLAVLRAELEVTERHNHSMEVSYVKVGMDATIAESSGKDFVFVNNYDAPIYIEGYAADGMVSFVIYGDDTRAEGREVSYENEILETYEPTNELTADPEASYGSMTLTQNAHTGYKAALYKIVRENGQETREQVNTSNYMMSPYKYTVGIKTDNSEAYSEMYAAIESNDLEKVYELRSKY